jgi:hypothetical protein
VAGLAKGYAMIAYGTAAQAHKRRRSTLMPDGGVTHRAEWMETGADRWLAPTAYLVEQPPNYTVGAHFHRQNEYQVIVHGSGMLGRHPLRPVTVHYAGAYTGYGPVVSGADGLHYFTLRPAFDPGPVYVGDHRGQMIRGPKRQLHGESFPPCSAHDLRTLSSIEEREIFALDDCFGVAKAIRLPPAATARGSDPAGSVGQFWMVIAGSMIHGGTVLGQWETLFLSADEPALSATAGPGGLEVLLLQVPRMANAYVTQNLGGPA